MDANIPTACPAGGADLTLAVRDGTLRPIDAVVHFSALLALCSGEAIDVAEVLRLKVGMFVEDLGLRSPRMQGLPPRLPGSMVIRLVVAGMA